MNETAYNPNNAGKPKPTFRERIFKALKKFLMVVCFAYLLIVVALVLMENQMIYPAPKFPAGNWEPAFDHQDVEFTSADGTGIHAVSYTQTRKVNNKRFRFRYRVFDKKKYRQTVISVVLTKLR